MNTYTVCFRSAEFALHDLKAETPEDALELAHEVYYSHPCELHFEPYDSMFEILVRDAGGNEVAAHQDYDVCLRLAARDLLAAAENVVARWERGDLAEAIRALCFAVEKAKGGAS